MDIYTPKNDAACKLGSKLNNIIITIDYIFGSLERVGGMVTYRARHRARKRRTRTLFRGKALARTMARKSCLEIIFRETKTTRWMRNAYMCLEQAKGDFPDPETAESRGWCQIRGEETC